MGVRCRDSDNTVTRQAEWKMSLKVPVCGIVLSWITLLLIEVVAEECNTNTGCTCTFQDGDTTAFDAKDTRSVGLAAATGALSSMVLAGGGMALWKYFKNRGSGNMTDTYGRPPSSQGSWMGEERRAPNRRGSVPLSDDGYDMSGRMTTASGRGHPTNIYKHGGKIWPGSR
ncbi:uncharacterized protein LOC124116805 [Haliotis rufescens]|uniref:uncharacterized protein LOC124116805 n=1 Tax=Haliotis rufescens TaxID=6454 RepID=UPI001EB083CC|nr:uncharacterized protein LOC124116805 [Haliotis rufescens]